MCINYHPLEFTHHNGSHFHDTDHIYRRASRETEWHFSTFDIFQHLRLLKESYLCTMSIFCKNMKNILMLHSI